MLFWKINFPVDSDCFQVSFPHFFLHLFLHSHKKMLQSASKLWKSRHRYTRSSLRHRKKIQIKFIWLQPWTFCFCVLSAARGRRWIELTVEEQRAYVMRLLDALEVTDRDKRLKVARAILYLAQGVWAAQNTSLFHSRHLGFRGNAHVLLLILTMAKSSTRSWQWARMHSTWNRMISLFTPVTAILPSFASNSHHFSPCFSRSVWWVWHRGGCPALVQAQHFPAVRHGHLHSTAGAA